MFSIKFVMIQQKRSDNDLENKILEFCCNVPLSSFTVMILTEFVEIKQNVAILIMSTESSRTRRGKTFFK